MITPHFQLIGAGTYSLAEAQRLTGIPRRRIRRWTEGYEFTSSGRRRWSPPIVASWVRELVDEPALTFGDLIEIRFLDAFLEHGVSWRSIRVAARRAQEFLGRHRPFSSRIFKTDGRTILAEIVTPADDPALLDLVHNQWEFRNVVSPMLYAGIEFNDEQEASRWWPLGERSGVVLDPLRSFGAPIVDEVGIRTDLLAQSARVEGSQRAAAEVWEVPLHAVRRAVRFERHYERPAPAA